MRDRINKTMNIVNSYQELSNLIIKSNPYADLPKKVQAQSSLGVVKPALGSQAT